MKISDLLINTKIKKSDFFHQLIEILRHKILLRTGTEKIFKSNEIISFNRDYDEKKIRISVIPRTKKIEKKEEL